MPRRSSAARRRRPGGARAARRRGAGRRRSGRSAPCAAPASCTGASASASSAQKSSARRAGHGGGGRGADGAPRVGDARRGRAGVPPGRHAIAGWGGSSSTARQAVSSAGPERPGSAAGATGPSSTRPFIAWARGRPRLPPAAPARGEGAPARAALTAAGRELALTSALSGRVVAADVLAAHDLPPFDNSAMDGYAVRAADAGGELPVAGQSFAGDDPVSSSRARR